MFRTSTGELDLILANTILKTLNVKVYLTEEFILKVG